MGGLSPGTSYSVRAYAVNSAGVSYGESATFTTLPPIEPATVVTGEMVEIGTRAATASGEVISDGGAEVSERGVVWELSATGEDPTLGNNEGKSDAPDGGTGSFTVPLDGLSPATSYVVRAYAVNSAGVSYGESTTFTTQKSCGAAADRADRRGHRGRPELVIASGESQATGRGNERTGRLSWRFRHWRDPTLGNNDGKKCLFRSVNRIFPVPWADFARTV
jgi:hypothetical protein